MRLAFYRYNSVKWYQNFYGYLVAYYQRIRGDEHWWYSHVELVIEKEKEELWYGSTLNSGVRARKRKKIKHKTWNYLDISQFNGSEGAELWFKKRLGKGYDLLAIFFSEFISLGIEDKDKYFCSEACSLALGLDESLLRVSQLYNKMLATGQVIELGDGNGVIR